MKPLLLGGIIAAAITPRHSTQRVGTTTSAAATPAAGGVHLPDRGTHMPGVPPATTAAAASTGSYAVKITFTPEQG